MAYKFQVGNSALSGALEQAGEVLFVSGDRAEGSALQNNFTILQDGNVDVPQHNGDDVGLMLGGVVISATAAELNKLDGADADVTAAKLNTLCDLTNTEIGFVDGALAGTVVASKNVVYSAAGLIQGTDFKGPDGFDIGNGSNADALKFNASELIVKDGVDFSVATAGGFNYGGAAVTSTAGELNLLDTAAAGTVINSKAVIYGASGQVNGTSLSASTGMTGSSLVIGAAGTTGASISNTGYLSFVGMADNWTNAGITVADLGSITTVDINGGSIDGAVIGANSAQAGTFAALVGTSLDLTNGNITQGGDINCDSVSVVSAGDGLHIDGSGAQTTKFKFSMGDNLAAGLEIKEGNNNYLSFATTDGSELINFGKDTSYAGTLKPDADSTRDLGTSALRWSTIYVDSIVGADVALDVESYGAVPLGTTISGSTDFALIKSGSATGVGGATYTLPTAAAGKTLHVKLSGSQANVTLKAAADDAIEDTGAAGSIYLESTGSAVTLICYDATHWFIV